MEFALNKIIVFESLKIDIQYKKLQALLKLLNMEVMDSITEVYLCRLVAFDTYPFIPVKKSVFFGFALYYKDYTLHQNNSCRIKF